MRTKTKHRCNNCGGKLVDEYRSGGYDFIHRVICLKCTAIAEDIWPGKGWATKAEIDFMLSNRE